MLIFLIAIWLSFQRVFNSKKKKMMILHTPWVHTLSFSAYKRNPPSHHNVCLHLYTLFSVVLMWPAYKSKLLRRRNRGKPSTCFSSTSCSCSSSDATPGPLSPDQDKVHFFSFFFCFFNLVLFIYLFIYLYRLWVEWKMESFCKFRYRRSK